MKFFLLVGALLASVAAVILFSNNLTVDDASDESSKVLNRGLVGEPESLDNHQFSSEQAAEVLRDIGEGLIAIAADGELRPGAAESWSISDDGLRYSFTIRGDARWSDGSKVTAHDFVATYRFLVDPSRAAINANAIQPVKNAESIIMGKAAISTLGVAANKDNLLQFELESPTPYFLQLLAHPSLYPINLAADANKGRSLRSSISNGAYMLDRWTKGSEILLKKNFEYWNAENVFFDAVTYHIVEEGSEFNRFRAGELDVTGTVESGIFPVAQREYPDELKVAPKLGIYYYGFNLGNPVFSDNLQLRAALSLAIDREMLAEKIIARGERPAYSWVPPGTYNYTPQELQNITLAKEYRESKARELYATAGYGIENVLNVEIRYNKSDVQERIALAIGAMWREVLGVNATFVSEEFQVLLENIRKRNSIEVFRISWTGNYNDAQTFLDLFESNHPQNLTGYSNATFDNLISDARTEVDATKRRSILEAAERVALNDHPVIPIYFYVSKHLVSNHIEGWMPNVLDIHLSQHLRSNRAAP